mmetsp:Transcript_12993/g.23353  ORF Transcript_12993/g.23353 Transcript_12993/m.23353 type:complete len:226 (+) Transcript_12993:558-1235(+)
MPGNIFAVKPCSFSFSGKVMGSLPLGFTSPKRTSARAPPISCPGRNIVSSAPTSAENGVRTAPGARMTATVRGQALPTVEAMATWAECSRRWSRSFPSAEGSLRTTTQASADRAAWATFVRSVSAQRSAVCCPAAARRPSVTVTAWSGWTQPEPPPTTQYARSCWLSVPQAPKTIIFPFRGRGSTPPVFFSSTADAAAALRETPRLAIETVLAWRWSCQEWSNIP